MNRKIMAVMLFVVIAAIPIIAIAQEEIPSGDIPINFSPAHGLIILVGALGGVTSAYLGSRKAKKEDKDYKFDIHNFLNRVILACITSIGLAITAAAGLLELNAVTLFLIFAASIGTAHLVKAART